MNNLLKKISWSVLAVSVLFQSCDSNEKVSEDASGVTGSGYNLTGNIEGLESDTVFLVKLNKNSTEVVDTATVGEGNTFSFTGKVDKAQYYGVQFHGNKTVDFVLDNEKLSLSTNANAPQDSLKIEGSKINREVQAYVRYFNNLLQERKELQQAYLRMQSREDKNEDSVKAVFDRLSNFEDERDQFTKQYIDSIYPSKAIFFIVSVLNKEPFIDYQAELSNKLLKEYPESPLAKEYNQTMDKILAQREAMQERQNSSSVKEGSKAPEISLPNPDGETVSLSSLKGNYVLLDFWASWCRPCRAENPNVVKTFNEYKDQDFKIYSVSLDSKKEAWVNAIEKDNLDHEGWYHVSDLKNWQSSVVPKYEIQGIPYTLLLDKEGNIIAKNLRGPALEEKLKEVLGKKAS